MGQYCITALCFGVLLASNAFGQVPPVPPPTPPNGVQAQPPPATTIPPSAAQAQPQFGYPTPLYRQADVARSLNLATDQANRLNQITTQTEAQYRDRFNAINTMLPAERLTRYRDLTREYLADLHRNSGEVFNETQRNRYLQLNYQYGGFNTFYDPAVQSRLTLTPAQVEALREQATWNDQQMQAINAANAAQRGQLYQTYMQQRQQRINTYLTPQQQRLWAEMTGEPYKFQPYSGR
jgi:hypothetical protein